MRYINIISLFIISLLICSCNNNEFEKNNDAVYKSIKKIYTLNDNGSINYQYQHQLKYITHNSFNRLFGESFIVYNPEQQELKINKAETKMADGKIISTPDNAFNEILPQFAAGVPAYNHLREMVVTHTALEPGCVVNFDYEVLSKTNYLPYLSENIILQEIVPVENLEIIVNIPENAALNVKLLNIENQAIVTKRDGFTQYKWKFKNLKSENHETNQPQDQSFLPRLIFSTTTLTDVSFNLFSENDLKLTDEIKVLVKKRTSGIKSGINIIRELQKMVGKEMNDIDIPIEYSADKIRPLNEVWNSNGGTNLEKTLLLNEFINYVGFESKVVMAISPDTYDPKIGCLADFEKTYIQVKIEGENLIISTNFNQANNLAFDIKQNVIIDLEGNSVNLPDYIYDIESSFMTNGNLDINALGKLTGKLNIKVQGIKSPYLKYLEDVENAKEIATSMFPSKTITDFQVLQFDRTKNEIEAQIEEKESWKIQGDYYFVEIPVSNYGIKGEHLYPLLNERKTPFYLSYPINESYDYTITIPDNFSFVAPEIKKEITNEIGSLKIEISKTDQMIHINKSLKINENRIKPEEYPKFKDLLESWNKKTYQEIILKKISE